MDRKWRCAVSVLIIMRNGTHVLPQMTENSGQLWWHFAATFLMKLHREFLFQGFSGSNRSVALLGGALYRGLCVNCNLISGILHIFVYQQNVFENYL
jgi:hypothetical protein